MHPSADVAEVPRRENESRANRTVDQVLEGTLCGPGLVTRPPGLHFFLCKWGLDKQFSDHLSLWTTTTTSTSIAHSPYPTPINRVLLLGA